MSHDPDIPADPPPGIGGNAELRGEVGAAALEPELLAMLREDELGARGSAMMLEQVHGHLEQEKGVLATLRSLPTGVRLSLCLGLVAMVLLWAGLNAAPGAPLGQVLVKLAALSMLAGVLLFVGMRPLYRRALPEGIRRGALFSAFAVPALLAFWGGGAGRVPFSSELLGAVPCFAKGALFSLPFVLLVAALHRGGRASTTVVLATAAGIGGNIVLESRCNGGAPGHIMFGHVGVILAYALLGLVVVWVRRALAGRQG